MLRSGSHIRLGQRLARRRCFKAPFRISRVEHFLLLFVCVAAPWAECAAANPTVLGSVCAASQINSEQVAYSPSADLKATVTYASLTNHVLYVQQEGCGLYIQPSDQILFLPGDRVRVRGTVQSGARPYVLASSVEFLSHGSLPPPVPASYQDLINLRYDGQLVSVRGKILAVDASNDNPLRVIRIRVLVQGDRFTARVDEDTANRLRGLLDADVKIVAVAASRQSGKSLQIASYLQLLSVDDIQVLKLPSVDPWLLPLIPFRDVLKSYKAQYSSRRVRVLGTVVLYRPGEVAVLLSHGQSLSVGTLSGVPLRVGEQVEAIGFPDLSHGLLSLTNAELKPLGEMRPLLPVPTTGTQLNSERNLYDLVSIAGTVVSVSRGSVQDEYILSADGAIFTALSRHGPSEEIPLDTKRIEPGSLVRVVGICFNDNIRPGERQQAFSILMRTSDDIVLLRKSSWFTAEHLVAIVGLLAAILIVAAIWTWILSRRVHEKSLALSRRVAADSATERRRMQLEARRSRILEDINGAASLASILEEITELVSLHLNGASCWCEIVDGARLGNPPADTAAYRVVSQQIPGRNRSVSGTLYAAFEYASEPIAEELDGLSVGVRVASLAIETRRVYSDLRHRSEYDLLTDVPNRFSLNHHLERLIERARRDARVFGLIYIDLDDFKRINDVCGHQVGDRFLQEAAARMKHQLRGRDMLARIGGDEFAALVAAVRSRAEVDEIAQRLERCLDDEIVIGEFHLHGAASVGIAMYPEDGATIDSLLCAADAAMYVAKNMRRIQRNSNAARVTTDR